VIFVNEISYIRSLVFTTPIAVVRKLSAGTFDIGMSGEFSDKMYHYRNK